MLNTEVVNIPSIFNEDAIFDIVYRLVDNSNISEAKEVLSKYAEVENFDKYNFSRRAIVYLLIKFSERYKNRIKFIKASDFANTLLSFLLEIYTLHDKDRMLELIDFLTFNASKKLKTMDKIDAIKSIMYLFDRVFDYEIPFFPFLLKGSFIAHSKEPIHTFEIDMLYDMINNLDFAYDFDEIFDIVNNTNDYIYVVVNDKIWSKYNIDYTSFKQSLDIDKYIELLKHDLAINFVEIIKSSKDLIPQYFYDCKSYADLIIADALNQGYKVYFKHELDRLIKENKAVNKFVKRYITSNLLKTNDKFKAIKQYLRFISRASNNDKTNKNIEVILNKYPFLKTATKDELKQMLNDMYEAEYNNLVTNRLVTNSGVDLFNLLIKEKLVNYTILQSDYSIHEFIVEAFDRFSDSYTLFNILRFIQEHLNYVVTEDEIFLLLTILNDAFKEDYSIKKYISVKDKEIPILVKLYET